jgi:hypothetical protein
MQFRKDKERSAVVWGLGIAVMLILLFSFISKQYSNPTSMGDTYGNIIEKKRILAEMRVQLHQSVEMEKNAVMAPTDEQSRSFAGLSRTASANVEQNLTQLQALINAVPLQDENKLVTEFAHCWSEFDKLDQSILEFAVQNTNYKATALSREKGGQTLQQFELALEQMQQMFAGTPAEGRAALLSDRAMIAALKMYALHSPHIAEASDEQMTHIEAQMHGEAKVVLQALDELAAMVDEAHREVVLPAKTAFADFKEVTATVIHLSRQNSNIKSLELSLGRKRIITAQCDEILAAFQDLVRSRTFKATK